MAVIWRDQGPPMLVAKHQWRLRQRVPRQECQFRFHQGAPFPLVGLESLIIERVTRVRHRATVAVLRSAAGCR
jgi:hypothetical protein